MRSVDFGRGGGIEASTKSGTAPNRFEERCRRTLAVGSRDMRGGIGAIRSAQTFGQHADVFEVELRRGGLRWCSEFTS
jgi:hypothetical protein